MLYSLNLNQNYLAGTTKILPNIRLKGIVLNMSNHIPLSNNFFQMTLLSRVNAPDANCAVLAESTMYAICSRKIKTSTATRPAPNEKSKQA